MEISLSDLRARLRELHWGDGLTRDEILAQDTGLPREPLRQLPAGFRFRDADEVMSYIRHLLEHGVLPDDPTLYPVRAPRGYGESPTGRTFSAPEHSHGVGSGAGSGYTGSDAQTGEDQRGVDYTDED